MIDVKRIAAFSYQNSGGNPAGVWLGREMPSEAEMLDIAKQVGYSETAFLKPEKEGWRIRYFAPEIEVPFCGHATIASGAVLGAHAGVGVYRLYLNDGEINITVSKSEAGVFTTTLESPNTWSTVAANDYLAKILATFNLTDADLDKRFPARIAFAGAKHLILILNKREKLSAMSYDYERLKELMSEQALITINLLWQASDRSFHSRNPFPPGGVYEDPATGAAAAAFAGYLRDIGWAGGNRFEVLQGHDIGMPSQLLVEFSDVAGEGVKVTGETRAIANQQDEQQT